MPVPKVLSEDIEKANESNSQIEESVDFGETQLILDDFLDGCYSFTFIDDASQKNGRPPKQFVAGHGNGAIALFDISDRSGKPSRFLKHGSSTSLPIVKLLTSSQNPNLIYAASVDGNIYICNPQKVVPDLFSYEEGNEPMGMCLIESANFLVTAGKDTHVRIYDVKTNQISRAYHGSRVPDQGSSQTGRPVRKIFSLKNSSITPSVFFSGGWDDSLKIWDSRTPDGVVKNLFHKTSPPHICGDSIDVKVCGGIGLETIVTGSWRHKRALQLWDPSVGKLMRNVKFPSTSEDGEYLYACRFVNDSSLIAGGSGTKDAVLINFHTGQPIRTVGDGSKAITAIETHEQSGQTLVGGSSYNIVHVLRKL